MACPFFEPTNPLPDLILYPTPLGDLYMGCCRASGREPDESHARQSCNFGYARGRCSDFPEAAPSDAVRFSILAASADLVRLRYSTERDHYPREQGEIEIARNGAPPDDTLTKQAGAFVAAYRRRKD